MEKHLRNNNDGSEKETSTNGIANVLGQLVAHSVESAKDGYNSYKEKKERQLAQLQQAKRLQTPVEFHSDLRWNGEKKDIAKMDIFCEGFEQHFKSARFISPLEIDPKLPNCAVYHFNVYDPLNVEISHRRRRKSCEEVAKKAFQQHLSSLSEFLWEQGNYYQNLSRSFQNVDYNMALEYHQLEVNAFQEANIIDYQYEPIDDFICCKMQEGSNRLSVVIVKNRNGFKEVKALRTSQS